MLSLVLWFVLGVWCVGCSFFERRRLVFNHPASRNSSACQLGLRGGL